MFTNESADADAEADADALMRIYVFYFLDIEIKRNRSYLSVQLMMSKGIGFVPYGLLQISCNVPRVATHASQLID